MNTKITPTIAALTNTLAFGFMIYLNYLGASGAVGGLDMGELSRKYDTLITPAGYAFSIWGFIYLLLMMLTAFQWIRRKDSDATVHQVTRFWLPVSHLANGAWVLVWSLEWLWLSVLVMVILLTALIKMAARVATMQEKHQSSNFIFVGLPIAVYIGWISIATVVNIAAVLGHYQLFPEANWAVILILAVATGIYIFLLRLPYLGAAGWVGAWAGVAIAVRYWQTEPVSGWAGIVIASILISAWIHKTVVGLRARQSI
jgi:hypothetical protein